ncbi:synaptosomal-associated protein 47 [Ctenodactylus gundi]
MSSHVCVHSWSCSYYLDAEKRWVPGRLSLTPCSLRFTADGPGDVLVGLPLSSIVAIRKEASRVFFSAITILEQGHLKHWFGSLQPSRNAVFSIIEHFWRELLLSQQGTAEMAVSLPRTRGQELAGLMASSQQRLEDTAKVLHHQGEQLDGVMQGLQKMESDLDVANRLLTELESPSWWPFSSRLWKTPAEAKPRADATGAGGKPFGKDGVVTTVPAVISQRTEAHAQPGRLSILPSGLEIQDSGASLLHRFEREDIDDITVHSPYEVSIRQRFIGKPDVAYRVISAKMPAVLPILEAQFGRKMGLPEDTAGLSSTAACPPAHRGSLARRAAPGLLALAGGQEAGQLQLQKSQPLLSKVEAQELAQSPRSLTCLVLTWQPLTCVVAAGTQMSSELRDSQPKSGCPEVAFVVSALLELPHVHVCGAGPQGLGGIQRPPERPWVTESLAVCALVTRQLVMPAIEEQLFLRWGQTGRDSPTPPTCVRAGTSICGGASERHQPRRAGPRGRRHLLAADLLQPHMQRPRLVPSDAGSATHAVAPGSGCHDGWERVFLSTYRGHLCCPPCTSQTLSRMRGLALEATAELERQDQALDGITTAVDHATLTMDKHTQRMKRSCEDTQIPHCRVLPMCAISPVFGVPAHPQGTLVHVQVGCVSAVTLSACGPERAVGTVLSDGTTELPYTAFFVLASVDTCPRATASLSPSSKERQAAPQHGTDVSLQPDGACSSARFLVTAVFVSHGCPHTAADCTA